MCSAEGVEGRSSVTIVALARWANISLPSCSIVDVFSSLLHSPLLHLCFNITEKGNMIVPDLNNMISDYTRKYTRVLSGINSAF